MIIFNLWKKKKYDYAFIFASGIMITLDYDDRFATWQQVHLDYNYNG